MTTINIVCYKSKTLANGEHPLMLRVTKDRKTKYQSLGISIHSDYWDFKKNEPKSNYSNKDVLMKILLSRKLELQKQLLELEANEQDYTLSTLILPKKKKVTKTVNGFCKEIIEELKKENRIGNAQIYQDCLNCLNNFTEKKLDIPFSSINYDFLVKYELWMKKKRNLKKQVLVYNLELLELYITKLSKMSKLNQIYILSKNLKYLNLIPKLKKEPLVRKICLK